MAKFYATRTLNFYILTGVTAFLLQALMFSMNFDLGEGKSTMIIVASSILIVALTTFGYLIRKFYLSDIFFEKPLGSVIAFICLSFAILLGVLDMTAWY